MSELTIFFDGDCPLCSAEMRHLKAADLKDRIALENIRAAGFNERFPEIDYLQALEVLHGRTADGRILTGLDVTEQAWTLVGFGPFMAPLRCSLTRPLFDRAYRHFARNRHRISRWLMAASSRASCPLAQQLVPAEFKAPRAGADSGGAEDECGCGKP